MRKIFCTIEEKYDDFNGETVILFEGPEIFKKDGCKRFFQTKEGYKRYDNFDEWTIEKKEDLILHDGSVVPYYALHLNPYSKPHKPQIIKGNGFLFIG